MRLWDEFLATLEKQLSKENIDRWVRSLKLVKFDAANIYLEAKEPFQANWFEEHIRPHESLLKNPNGRLIKIHLLTAAKTKTPYPKKLDYSYESDSLIDCHSFDHFEETKGNALAVRLLLQTLEKTSFNPIFLYGKPATGKTHLLMSFAKHLREKGKKVFYVRAETFTSHVIGAIKFGHMQNFRKAYRNIDVLLLDNVQVFGRKSATQEEFFHTFNTLHTEGKQILLAADASPQELSHIEPRLISRFEWGISVQLEEPTSQELKKILQKKANAYGLNISEDAQDFLLESFQKRESLLMAFDAINLRAQTKTLSKEAISHLIHDLLQKEGTKAYTPEEIFKGVAHHYDISLEDLLGKGQTREVAFPRKLAMFLLRKKLALPFVKIGDLCGRDHSTVMTGVRFIEKKMSEELEKELVEILQKIK